MQEFKAQKYQGRERGRHLIIQPISPEEELETVDEIGAHPPLPYPKFSKWKIGRWKHLPYF